MKNYQNNFIEGIGNTPLIKLKAEKEIKKIKNNRVKISIAKIPGINTKQTLSLISKNLPNFRDLISENEEIFKKVFFKN